MKKLAKRTRKFFADYDHDCIEIWENQLGQLEEVEQISGFWNFDQSPCDETKTPESLPLPANNFSDDVSIDETPPLSQCYAPVKKVIKLCDECAFANEKVVELGTHMRQQHNSTHPRYCLYCNKFFTDNLKYMEHINKNHGLPVWDADSENNQNLGILHSEQAFGGVLKTYDIQVGEHEIDLLSFMRSKRDEIENVVQLNTQNQAQKLQFSALVQLTKPSNDENVSSQPDRIKLYMNSKTQRVDFTGLSKSCFAGMVEQMLLALNNFASHGSGWTVDRIENIELRLDRSKPIAASSYLALPTDLAKSQYLLNIRNRQDEKCFLYCYTAQFHKTFGPQLIPPNAPWRQKQIQSCTVRKI